MKLNVAEKAYTHEGARAHVLPPEHQLQRSVTSCLLWEDGFYESGQEIAKRIEELVAQCRPEFVAGLAITARTDMKLRHVPLLLVRAMARLPNHKAIVAKTLEQVIQRPDELTEFLAIYWKDGRQPLSAQVKKGLGKAFAKFSEYSLAKYNPADAKVRLRDVLFLSHAKPKDATVRYTKVERKRKDVDWTLREHEKLYKRIVNDTLASPETWENQLSAGGDKKQVFTSLMLEKKLGGLAFLRNLRNMHQSGVDRELVEVYMQEADLSRVLPFRFISAARAVPVWEDIVEAGMLRALEGAQKLPGTTALLIDGSASMEQKVSSKSDISRRDAACALAILLREICESVRIIAFSSEPWDIPPRRGFALRDAIAAKVIPQSTLLGRAVRYAQASTTDEIDRIIVITDEQSQDTPPAPQGHGYVINVSTDRNGIGYGPWVHIDGWSESIIEYIRAYEEAQ